MAMDTQSANKSFLPDQVGELVVEPVTRESVAAQASNVVPVSGAHQFRVPIVAADPSAAWTGEGDEIDTSEMGLGEVVTPFFKLAGLTVISNELAADTSPEAAELIGAGLARDIATQLDGAYFGTNITEPGEPPVRNELRPQGLEDLADVNEIDAGTAWENVDAFSEATYAAEGVGAALTSFVANPADALAIAKVKRGKDSNEPLLSADPTQPARRLLNGVPLLVSPAVTQGTIWGLPKARSIVAMREPATLAVDGSAHFTSDQTAIRAIMRVGFVWAHAAAIQKIQLSGS